MSGDGGGGGSTGGPAPGEQPQSILGLAGGGSPDNPLIAPGLDAPGPAGLIFPGSVIPGFTPAQKEGRRLGRQAARGPLTSIAEQALKAFGFFTGEGLDPGQNQNVQSAIEAAIQPLFQNLTESVLPSIRGGAITAGGFGGSRQGIAEGLAAGRTADAAGNVGANISNQAFQRLLQAGVQALGLGPQVAQLQLAPSAALSAIGGERQALQGARLAEDKQNFLLEQTLPFTLAQQILGLAFGIPGGSTTTTGSVPGASPFQSGLGGAATGAAIGTGVGGPGFGTGIGALLGLLGGLVF